MGIRIITAPEFLPWHHEALGVTWDQLSPEYQAVFLSILKSTGALLISFGFAVAVIVLVPFRRGEAWADWAILGLGVVTLPLIAYPLVLMQVTTEGSPPWFGPLIGLILIVAGFFLSTNRRSDIRMC